jgi:hypothetical protein
MKHSTRKYAVRFLSVLIAVVIINIIFIALLLSDQDHHYLGLDVSRNLLGSLIGVSFFIIIILAAIRSFLAPVHPNYHYWDMKDEMLIDKTDHYKSWDMTKDARE